jgi:REP element-mobilizing transposase RayT
MQRWRNLPHPSMVCQPEHVHALAEIPEGICEEKVVRLLKGVSAHDVLKDHPVLRAHGSLWAGGADKTPIPQSDLPVVADYIKIRTSITARSRIKTPPL